MTEETLIVQKPVRMTMWRAVRLQQMAERIHVRDDELIEKALDLLFAAEAVLGSAAEQSPGSTKAEPLPEDEVLRELIQAGVLDRHGWQRAPTAEREFVPIEIQGEPLSETIIKERR
jgi:hypothetical protein